MALLQSKFFKHIEKERCTEHEPAEATYTKFSKNGRSFFQIDTYGTRKRRSKGKISQSIQVDKEMAEVLVSKLRETFGLR